MFTKSFGHVISSLQHYSIGASALHTTFEACRRAGTVAVSARHWSQLKNWCWS